MPVLNYEKLRRLSVEIFKVAGVPDKEAELVSEFLVKANLAGHDSHGVIRIPPYVKRIRKGEVVPGAKLDVVSETHTTALLNGNWGLGQVVGTKAMKMAIEKAKKNMVGVVCAFNCNHVGRLADYMMMAVEEDMIGIAAVNSLKGVAPYGGMERMLSTNPISYAFPTNQEKPFVLDIATSVCAEGKVRVKLHKGEKLPDGWIIDKEGNPSNNPADFYSGGAILPLGGEVGYKGFGLSLAVEVLGGILSKAGCSYLEAKKGNGVFMEAINIEGFISVDNFKEEMDNLIRAIKNSKPRPGFDEILIPGEIEFRTEQKRLHEGIYIPEKTWNEIKDTAKKLGIDIEEFI